MIRTTPRKNADASSGAFLLFMPLQRAKPCRKHAEHDLGVHLRAKALDSGVGKAQGPPGSVALHRRVGALAQARSRHRAEIRQQGGAPALSFSYAASSTAAA